MTNTPYTSPEAVERYALKYNSDDDMQHMEPDTDGGWVRYDEAAALAAALEAERAENARLRHAITEASAPDFLWGAMDNVTDMDTTLADYAAAASRAIRAAVLGEGGKP